MAKMCIEWLKRIESIVLVYYSVFTHTNKMLTTQFTCVIFILQIILQFKILYSLILAWVLVLKYTDHALFTTHLNNNANYGDLFLTTKCCLLYNDTDIDQWFCKVCTKFAQPDK